MLPPTELTEDQLVGVARDLHAASVPTPTRAERALLARAGRAPRAVVDAFRAAIRRGDDPLGESFCRLRAPAERRQLGATYTPPPLVEAMVAWARAHGDPATVIDPGTGSGRFLVAAGRAFPDAALVGVELDPLAALLARAHLAARGLAPRARVVVADYRTARLDRRPGPTLFLGNPPYVRHHDLSPAWKRWLSETAARRGRRASQLAGLHVHFFLATLEHARPGDYGSFVTAAEWLDVNYGVLVRDLFVDGLGGSSLHVVEPTVAPFADALTTAAIACFHVGARPARVLVRRVASLGELGALSGGRPLAPEALRSASRWTPLTRPARRVPPGHVELGELCRVGRGQVTGANAFWIAGPHAAGIPDAYLRPAVTRARELFAAGGVLLDPAPLRRVIDLPEDLDGLPREQRATIERLLRRARAAGVHEGYVARHRRAWWAVGLYDPAPILATYMARRPPAFVRNLAGARHINVAHGLYPRVALSEAQLDALARHLAASVSLAHGRTYAGGLTKFEPGEMERLLVPAPERLAGVTAAAAPGSRPRVARKARAPARGA